MCDGWWMVLCYVLCCKGRGRGRLEPGHFLVGRLEAARAEAVEPQPDLFDAGADVHAQLGDGEESVVVRVPQVVTGKLLDEAERQAGSLVCLAETLLGTLPHWKGTSQSRLSLTSHTTYLLERSTGQ